MPEDSGVESADIIRLSIPHDERFVGVARIVVGGLAARLDLPYESMDDLQLAVERILSEPRYTSSSEVTVEAAVFDHSVVLSLGPLDDDQLSADLDAVDADSLSLGVLLGAVVDSVTIEGRAEERWLRLEKAVAPRPSG